MKKRKNNEIREQVRNELSRKFKEETERAKDEAVRWHKKYEDKCRECNEYYRRAMEAEEKLRQCEDWNRRLMEYMDMPDDEREKEFEKMKNEYAVSKTMKKLSDFASILFH